MKGGVQNTWNGVNYCFRCSGRITQTRKGTWTHVVGKPAHQAEPYVDLFAKGKGGGVR